MTELLSAISAASVAAGHTVELVFDAFPPSSCGCVYVVIPHEFQAWGDPRGFPNAGQRARTIVLCTENPGTEWFEATYQLVPEFAAAVSINRSSAAELQERGIRCEHVQLGYSPLWDSWLRDESVERRIDVLYLGAADPRRDPLVGSFGRRLWARECEFLIPPLEPRTGPRPDFLKGAEKYHRLRSAQVLLNLHRTTSSALEWMRFLEAICNGCVVVSEPCADNEPLIPGEHFVAASADSIASVIDNLLDDPERLQQIRERAYDFIRKDLRMDAAGARLAEVAAKLPLKTLSTRDFRFSAERKTIPPPSAPPQAEASPGHESSRDHEPRPHGASPNVASIQMRTPKRLLKSISHRIAGERRPVVQILAKTASYARTKPRVTVLIHMADGYEHEAVGALSSAAASLHSELEVLILADASRHRSGAAARGFLDDHPSLPAAVLQQPVNRGLAYSRNTLAEHARGEFLFILEAEGGIYPSTVDRLVTALDADSEAFFAYPMVAVFDGGRSVELVGSLPWEPERLTKGNWIDAMALIRREPLLKLGGYSTDPRLAGWEDFELWCKCAEAEGRGVHIPQVLAWRRRTARSVATGDETGAPATWALMRARFPRLLTAASLAGT